MVIGRIGSQWGERSSYIKLWAPGYDYEAECLGSNNFLSKEAEIKFHERLPALYIEGGVYHCTTCQYLLYNELGGRCPFLEEL